MQLTELNIVGFKSFAKKVNVILDEGITAVVGPNGCGKSNIVDAIRWVMGEQRSGALRSDRMENVIFAGSASAKPVGMAEVSLKILNTKNILPVDYSEVVVTRRLFRSGESQYLINGNQVRLKDITSLFMDTGMGSQSYSVIELPQVEKLLNGKPEERRIIFEEAAGITKYKLRRKATFHKLEGTEKDLIRIEDIMSEVEKSVRSLRRQVSRAQKFQKVSTELKDMEINLATQEYSRILTELEPLQGKLSFIQKDRASASASLAQNDATYESLRSQLLNLEKQLSAEQTEHNKLSHEIQKFEERVLVNGERVRSLKESRQRYTLEIEGLNERRSELQTDLDDASFQTKKLERDLKAEKESFEILKGENDTLRADYENKRRDVREADSEILRITESLSKKQTEGERLKATQENMAGRISQIEQEKWAATERQKTLNDKILEMQEEEKGLSNQLLEAQKEFENATQKSDEARKAVENLNRAEIEDNNRIEVLENQAEMIKQLLESYQDYPAGVKYLATLESDQYQTHGAVANLIRVQQQHRAAIAAALGPAATYLVVDDDQSAFSGIGLLKQDKKGIVTFLPLKKLSGFQLNQPSISDLGILGWANELVQVDSQYEPFLKVLLSDYLVVQDIETATRVKDKINGQPINIVTLSGEVLGYQGIIRGGSQSKRQTDFVGRQEKLAALNQEIETLRQKSNQRKELKSQRETEAQHFKSAISAYTLEIKKHEKDLSTLRIDLGKLSFEAQSINETRKKWDEEHSRLLNEVSKLGLNLELQGTDAQDLQQMRLDLNERRKNAAHYLAEFERILAESNTKVQAAHIKVTKLQSDFEAQQRENDSLLSQVNETKRMIDHREFEIKKAGDEIQELTEVNETYTEQVEELSGKRSALKTKIDELKEEQYQINVKTNEQEQAIRSARGKADELSESVHKMELRLSELKMQNENIKARMLEEFEYTITKEPMDPKFDWDNIRNSIHEQREMMKRIGPVNLLALKEYEQEKERFDFLQTQREDLLKARRDLTNTIDIINKTARDQFLNTFEQVQKNFTQVFTKFFDGGRASLVLREGNDPLEAEIDIYATPAGKRLSSLQILSGGEKSLTAISLLFAIYLVKPSPFCIFDEVDAPLDDRNIVRFSKALEDFSENTQFIVVTHNKLTMRAAHQMYGVTMESEGVSKVVSVKFENAGQATTAEPVAAE